IDWLTPFDYGSQQSDYIGRRQPGTGQWLLGSAEYQTWLKSQKQTLFCPGIPGAGKTIITSIVVEELTTHFQSDERIGIAYLYCDFRRQDEQKADNLLGSLLKQLTQCQSSLLRTVKELYERYKDKRIRPLFDKISKALHSIAAEYSRAFIVIDVLDEYQAFDGCRTRFLSEIFSLQAKYGANIFATSRFIPEITEKFERSLLIEIRTSDEDVRRYLDSQMFRLPGFVVGSPELQEEIKTEIIRAVDGMFLLIQLYLDSLIGKIAPKTVRAALKKLPTGSGAYDYVYEDTVERIKGQVIDAKELGMKVLSWIACAKRPLKTTELQHALAVEVGEVELDQENLPQIEAMASVYTGLVTVDKESKIIRLVYYTTQEYFERIQKRWFPNAEANITIICITYLSFDIFEHGYYQTDDEFEERLRSNRFFEYAARNWGYHARKISTLSQALSQVLSLVVVEFLKSEAKVNASSQGLLAIKHYLRKSKYSQKVPRWITGLHLTAYFGVEAIVKLLLDISKADKYDKQTSLLLAAKAGHKAIVQLLLEIGKVDIDSKDESGRTPLSWAAGKGHETFIQLLLDTGKVDINSKDESGRTPLWWAASHGREAMVKLLLETGRADVDLKDSYNQTPLSWAAENGHEAMVKLLLDNGADISIENRSGWTALQLAALNTYESIEQLLVIHGAPEPDDFIGFRSCFCKVVFKSYYIYFHNLNREGLGGPNLYILYLILKCFIAASLLLFWPCNAILSNTYFSVLLYYMQFKE
ncbi:uncharacterized protein K444DRAFT_548252, partial [Hyaloscypha bicolor E]